MTEVAISARIPFDLLQSSVKKAFRETEIHDSFKLKPDWVDGPIYIRKESENTCSADTPCAKLLLPFWARKPISFHQLMQSVIYTILNRNNMELTAEAGE